MILWAQQTLSVVVPKRDIVLALQLTKGDSKYEYRAAKNLLEMNKLREAKDVLSSVAEREHRSLHWSESQRLFFYARKHPEFGHDQTGMAQQAEGSSWRFKVGDEIVWR